MFVCLFLAPQCVGTGGSVAYIDLIQADWGGSHDGVIGLAHIMADGADSDIG